MLIQFCQDKRLFSADDSQKNFKMLYVVFSSIEVANMKTWFGKKGNFQKHQFIKTSGPISRHKITPPGGEASKNWLRVSFEALNHFWYNTHSKNEKLYTDCMLVATGWRAEADVPREGRRLHVL